MIGPEPNAPKVRSFVIENAISYPKNQGVPYDLSGNLYYNDIATDEWDKLYETFA